MDQAASLPSAEAQLSEAIGHQGGRRSLPACYSDMELWTSFDDSKLQGADASRYKRRRDSVVAFMGGKSATECAKMAGVGRRRFLRLFQRIFEIAPDKRMVGWRALAPGHYAKQRKRSAPYNPDTVNGYSGMFRLTLAKHPQIEKELVKFLNARGLKGLRPNTLEYRAIHKKFLEICTACGLTADDYPHRTKEKARKALRRWIDTDYLPRHAMRFIGLQEGQEAAGLAAYGQGDGTAERPHAGYGAWIIDANTVDAEARLEFPLADGSWTSVRLRRFQHLRCIHLESTSNLAKREVYAPQVSALDLMQLLWDAVNGPEPLMPAVAGLLAEEGAGYPACMIPALRFAIPSVIYLDNALAHLSDHLQHIALALFGATVILGTPRTPHERATIESKFATQARRIMHKLPATSGTGPQDPIRDTNATATDQLVRAQELEYVLDVYVRNENALPAAGASYLAPLTWLRRALASGRLFPSYLPPDRRKAYYFCQPTAVTVKSDASSSRLPYVNFMYYRYSSQALGKGFALRGKKMYVRADHSNLRTVMLFNEDGSEYGPVQCLGRWGTFPHDMRIRKMYGRLKRAGLLGVRADDAPLECLFKHLRERAPLDRTAALQLTYLLEYLRRANFEPAEALARDIAEWEAAQRAARPLDLILVTPLPQAAVAPTDIASANDEVQGQAESSEGIQPQARSVPVQPTAPQSAYRLLRRRSV